jgi:hypothetical protein
MCVLRHQVFKKSSCGVSHLPSITRTCDASWRDKPARGLVCSHAHTRRTRCRRGSLARALQGWTRSIQRSNAVQCFVRMRARRHGRYTRSLLTAERTSAQACGRPRSRAPPVFRAIACLVSVLDDGAVEEDARAP